MTIIEPFCIACLAGGAAIAAGAAGAGSKNIKVKEEEEKNKKWTWKKILIIIFWIALSIASIAFSYWLYLKMFKGGCKDCEKIYQFLFS